VRGVKLTSTAAAPSSRDAGAANCSGFCDAAAILECPVIVVFRSAKERAFAERKATFQTYYGK